MISTSQYRFGCASITALVAAALCLPHVDAQAPIMQTVPGPVIYEPVGSYEGFSYVAARVKRDDSGQARATAQFVVTYTGFSPEAQAAFQYAVDIWSSIVQSSVPIRINAEWRTDLPPYVLGAAGTTMMARDFPNAPRANTYYPAALANARAGFDLSSSPEIGASFNANFPWYLGTDGNARSTFDFPTVVMHEIGHGLGFFGSMRVDNTAGLWGAGAPAVPLVYDWFVTDPNGRSLMDGVVYPNGSTALAAQLTSNDARFGGTNARRALGGSAPSLFSPSAWMGGSSIVHLNPLTFPAGDPNSLMMPSLAPGRVVHDPGQVTRGILADMGWSIADLTAPETTTALKRAPGNVRLVVR